MRVNLRVWLVGIVILGGLLACAAPAATPSAVPTLAAATLMPTALAPAPSFPGFTIAIEYALPGLAAAYAETGVRYAKPQMVFAVWGNLEPHEGLLDWRALDALVSEYQEAGFTGQQILISAESKWASINPSLGGETFPQEQYLDAYVAFVSRLVERYDGDGQDDMPDLRYPIHDYGIEREFTGFWPGSTENYLRLLRLAYPAIHAADPDARVLLIALLMTDIFSGSPDQAEIDRRLLTTEIGKSLSETLAVLGACDAYDIVDFHSLGDYSEIPPTAAWIRARLTEIGCEKPLWIGDAFSMSGLLGYGGLVPPKVFAPASADNSQQVVELLQQVADPQAAGHAESLAWLQAEMAQGLVRKVLTAAGEGILGINLGNMEDWKTGVPALDRLTVPAMGTSMFMGMMDTRRGQRAADWELPEYGQDWSRPRLPGEPRPMFHAFRFINQVFEDLMGIERLEQEEGIWLYQLTTANGVSWMAWFDDGRLHLPGEPATRRTLELRIGAPAAQVLSTPTRPGETDPRPETLESPGGLLVLELGPVPILIRPVR